MAQPRHFLDLKNHNGATLRGILETATQLKARRGQDKPLAGKTLAMIFDKPSTRTRISFDVGMRELGGESIYLAGADLQLGRGESIADTAKVLSRYVDIIMLRTTGHDRILELAEHATVPVINGLTDDSHPCQILADIMTFEEHKGAIRNSKIAWTGDGNNVLKSLIHAAAKLSFDLAIATPPELAPPPEILTWARKEGAKVSLSHDPYDCVEGADCVVTDTFVSMGDEESQRRIDLLMPYQVNDRLMAHAKPDAIFMHCLPAHRGEEVMASVIDGPQSVVFDEAENRLHAQKGILSWCLGS